MVGWLGVVGVPHQCSRADSRLLRGISDAGPGRSKPFAVALQRVQHGVREQACWQGGRRIVRDVNHATCHVPCVTCHVSIPGGVVVLWCCGVVTQFPTYAAVIMCGCTLALAIRVFIAADRIAGSSTSTARVAAVAAVSQLFYMDVY